MSSLSNAVQNTRRVVIAFIIFAVVVLVVQAISEELNNNTNGGGGGAVRYYSFPTATAGTYSRINLESIPLLNESPSEFVVVGDFPEFPPVVNVFEVKEKKVRLSPLEEAENIAERFELSTNYVKLDENNYIWQGGVNNLRFQFNIQDRSINITSDLLEASEQRVEFLEEEEYIRNAIRLTDILGLDPHEEINVSGRVDYIAVDAGGNKISLPQEESFLVRVTLFKTLESASLLPQYKNNTRPEIPPSVTSEVYRPDLLNGYVTLIFNGSADSLENIVELRHNPSEYEENTDTQTFNEVPFAHEVYSTIELGQALENLKVKAPGSFLVYLKREGENIFSETNSLNVAKFNIQASSTKTVYIEPESWDHLNPDAEWNAHLYPFYWFEGQATLDNGEVAEFVFLVDVIPTN